LPRRLPHSRLRPRRRGVPDRRHVRGRRLSSTPATPRSSSPMLERRNMRHVAAVC
jgi:hypothetical protein